MQKSDDIQNLIKALSKIQGFGNRSAVRATINLISNKEEKLEPLIDALSNVANNIKTCPVCGNFDTVSPCSICNDAKRDSKVLCIISDISSLWAMERGNIFNGKYHITGGILSAINGVEPSDLNLSSLKSRIVDEGIEEVILALPATVDAKITSHYIINLLKDTNVKITELAHGVPLGGELDYLDEGTIGEAIRQRKLI
ncbi:recombination protein RecR [bacterium]|nr:recombination protein RecR [bacterium]